MLNKILPQPVTDFACGGTEDFVAAYHQEVIMAQAATYMICINSMPGYYMFSQEIKAMPLDNVVARHYTSNVRHLWRDVFFRI